MIQSQRLRTREEVQRARYLLGQAMLHPDWTEGLTEDMPIGVAVDVLDWVLLGGTVLFASLLDIVGQIVEEEEALEAVRTNRQRRRKS